MRKIIISIVLSLGFLAPIAGAKAHKYELVVNSNSTLIVARNALKRGKFIKAINFYKRALRMGAGKTGEIWAYNDLCVAYYLKTDLKEALGFCNQAIKLAPNEWLAYNNRGNILYSSGFFDEAQKSYETALRLNPSSDVIQGNLALVVNRQMDVLPGATPFQFNKKKKRKNPTTDFMTSFVLD